jgi:hypothetical protein
VRFIHSVGLTPNGCLADSAMKDLIRNSAASSKLVARTDYQAPEIVPSRMPTELDVLSWGGQQDPHLRWVRVDEETASNLPGNQKAFNLARVPIVVPGEQVSKNSAGTPAKIGGLGDPKVIPGRGLVLANIDWNDDGRASLLHFTNLRPEVLLGDDQCVVGLWSVWLSNSGGIGFHNLPRFLQLNAASAKRELKGRDRMVAGLERQNLTRLQAEQRTRGGLSLLHSSREDSRSDMVERLVTLHSTLNPETGQPFTRNELSAQPLIMLRGLLANAPRKLHGRELMIQTTEGL